MVVEPDCLVVEGKRFKSIVEKEVDSLFSQFQSQTLQERDIVIHKLIIILGDIEMFACNQLIHESVCEYVNYRNHTEFIPYIS